MQGEILKRQEESDFKTCVSQARMGPYFGLFHMLKSNPNPKTDVQWILKTIGCPPA